MISSGVPCATAVKGMCDRRRVRAVSPNKSTVRRALFGPPDHDKLREDLDRQMSLLKAADANRWNFDFTGESPLPGRIEWEKVEDSSPEVPIAYAMPCVSVCGLDTAVSVRYTNSRFIHSTTTSGVDEDRRVPSLEAAAELATPAESRTSQPQSPAEESKTTQKTVQSKISTFFPVKRRTTETSESPAKRRRRHLTPQRTTGTISTQ